jgi:hypothetical protein
MARHTKSYLPLSMLGSTHNPCRTVLGLDEALNLTGIHGCAPVRQVPGPFLCPSRVTGHADVTQLKTANNGTKTRFSADRGPGPD